MFAKCLLLIASVCHVAADKPVTVMANAQAAAIFLDYRQTLKYNGPPVHPIGELDGQEVYCCTEVNPLVRPFVRHSAELYALGGGEVISLAFLAHRMRESHSRIVRDAWWLPQAGELAANVVGYISVRNEVQSLRKQGLKL